MAKIRCELVNVKDQGHKIELPPNQKIFLGRTIQTKIEDLFCSRKQMWLKANPTERYVLVKPCGANAVVGLNGFRLDAGGSAYEAVDGDIVEVILDKYQFRVSFVDDDEKTTSKRRLSVQSEDEMNATKIAKVEPDEEPETKWEKISNGQLLLLTRKGVKASPKIAAYDIDGTIIKTQSGKVFPKDIHDWQLAYSEVPGKLKTYFNDGYKIVFLTNQSSIGKNKMKPEDFRTKLERIISKINIPIQVLVATGTNVYRKPMPGMWEHLQKHGNGGVQIDMMRSFYVGDAAGRPAKPNSKVKKDHSSCDRLLALNLNLPFLTPEEHFQNAKTSPWVKPEFDPRELQSQTLLLEPKEAKLTIKEKEIVIMVGCPGSGKSFFVRKHYSDTGYFVVNRDTLGSWQKCVQEAERVLQSGKSVCVDNTNPDVESRKRYVDLSKKHKIPIRCFLMTTTYKHCKHNILFREILNPNHPKINDIVLNSFKAKFSSPETREGFSEVVRVNFSPEFGDPDHETLYRRFLLDS